MNAEYDFYTMGQRYGNDHLFDLKAMAKQIGNKYGLDAKLEFEAGISSIVSSYQEYTAPVSMKDVEHATANYGVESAMNNSYLGSSGAGRRL